jgi:hypothetical protein
MGGGGAHVDIGPLLSPEHGQPITGLFPFLDARGQAICFSNGEPVGLRLGFSRSYTLLEQPHSPSDDRRLLEGRLKELCEEAGRLILDLPPKALNTIWERWGVSICLPDDDTFCWLDALFEYGWTPGRRRQGLPRCVHDMTGYGSVVLQGNGLFPRVPGLELGELLDSEVFPTEAGHPFRWSSKIDDTTSASIDLLEWIAAEGWTDMVPSERSSNGGCEDASPVEVGKQLPSGLDVLHHGPIFLSYVRENESLVQRLYQELTAAGLTVWFDRESLDPGVRWKSAIRDGIRKGSFFIACFSKEYVSRDTSYMNEELTLAIEELRRRPTEKAWFIPVRLSDCEIPDRDIGAGETLRDLHYVDLFPDLSLGVQRLISLFKKRGA